jgi:hypothetical protein
MTEHQRIEQLAEKLSHPLIDIRHRAAQNLLSKIQNKSIASRIFNLIKHIAISTGSTMLAVKVYSNVIDLLFKFTTSDQIDETVRQKVEETIESISYVQRIISTESDIPMNRADFQSEEIDINDIDTESYINKEDKYSVSHFSSNEKKEVQKIYHSGAGAILHSSLVFQGWKFPSFLLTDSDERHLFDLEVKVKLNHHTCVGLLWDILSDFPPHVLFERQGLLQALLDVLGSSSVSSSSSYLQQETEYDLTTLNPLVALQWFQQLFKMSRIAYIVQEEGSLCSSVPISFSENNTGGSNAIDEFGVRMPINQTNIAADLAKTMFAMRHPVLLADNSENEEKQRLQRKAVLTEQTYSSDMRYVEPLFYVSMICNMYSLIHNYHRCVENVLYFIIVPEHQLFIYNSIKGSGSGPIFTRTGICCMYCIIAVTAAQRRYYRICFIIYANSSSSSRLRASLIPFR